MTQSIAHNLAELERDVLRLAPFAVLVADESQTIKMANERARELLLGQLAKAPDPSPVAVGLKLDRLFPSLNFGADPAVSDSQLIPLGEDQAIYEFQCVPLDLGNEALTVVYFHLASSGRQREMLLEKEASTDELSGLANRRAFQRTIESHVQKSLSLAIIDIDRFKRLNDEHGHVAGDETVRQMGKLLRESFDRVAILVSRMGGDEFSVLFESEKSKAVLDLLNKLRTSFAQGLVSDADSAATTISIGVALADRPGIGSRALLTCADRQLYKAKTNGGDQICSAGVDRDDRATGNLPS